MYKFQTVFKSGALSLFAAAVISLFGLSRADAASYTYSLTGYAGLTGIITTSCDNCALNASNITAWSMTLPGVLSIASTVPGAQTSVPAGDTDMVATPEGITFNFGGGFGGIKFSGPSGSITYANGPASIYNPSFGDIAVCSNAGSGCTYPGGSSDIISIASASVPFVGSVVYTFTGKVTSATGIYATAGTTVSGTFALDLDAGDGALPFSLTTPWSSSSTGTSQLVASTLKSGSVTFSDAGSTSNKTTVAGLASTGSSAPNEYFASDTEFSGATKSVQHSLQIVGGSAAKAPFDSNGLPIFQNGTGTGTLLASAGNGTVGQLTYTLTSLTATPTTLTVSPARLTFPDTLINTQSAPLTVTLTNTSPNEVSIEYLRLDGQYGSQSFKITANNCTAILSAKASCSVSIVFVPFMVGPGGDPVLMVGDDAQGSPQLVPLDANGTLLPAPVPTLTTTALTFPGQQVGTTSAAQFITLKNTGNAPLTIFSITLAPTTYRDADAFTLLNHCVPTLAPGRACTVFVSFTPVVAGQASASLVISDNVAFYPESGTGASQLGQSISVSGTGTTGSVPGLKMDRTSVNFADQITGTASVKKYINLFNTGTAPLKISSIALAGSHASDFILQNACVPSLPAGHHCTVFVTFKPSTAGELSAAVVVTSNAVGSESVAALYGTATPATAPVLKLSTTDVGFGAAPYPRLAVDLTNIGTAPLSLASIAIVGNEGSQSYFTLQNDCVPVLQPGKLCALFITFNPMTATSPTGRFEATLVINDNAQVAQQSVHLEGDVPCDQASGC